ncbi:unnamed protein product [Cuscuta europaea]|uniref:Uncharacterized protein n=1 Tax=Cuscuta europaea TaxID=41803 RepID=A0A9P1EE97_CUSEU|nr:unnamed protein product [Cuscuta europaea]
MADKAEIYHLLRPLRPPTVPETIREDQYDFNVSSSFTFHGILFIAFIALLSLWANHEAAKGFSISVINDAGDTAAGKRFDLFYVSNDHATRLILERSKFVEDIISHTHTTCHRLQPKKDKIKNVILRLSSRNLTRPAMIESGEQGIFVINLSPSVMADKNFKHATFLAVQRGMALIWLWESQRDDDQTSLKEKVIDGDASLDWIIRDASSIHRLYVLYHLGSYWSTVFPLFPQFIPPTPKAQHLPLGFRRICKWIKCIKRHKQMAIERRDGKWAEFLLVLKIIPPTPKILHLTLGFRRICKWTKYIKRHKQMEIERRDIDG